MASILDVKDTQFRLGEDGVISYQAVESNPLPGEAIAKLVKGETPLAPAIEISNAKGADEAALKVRLEAWRDAHIGAVLELIVGLKKPFDVPETVEAPKEETGESDKSAEGTEKAAEAKAAPAPLPPITPEVQAILDAVYDSMGILPREDIEDLIAKISADDRRVLRAKRVRLGPILVFIPALNKPAGVRLRGLLWSLYNDAPLPANVPNDGIVSQVVEGEVNKAFYQAIGYPVFGNRAIRIDMLDRVICSVYDSAEKGKFRAQHQMAEWLGCPIDDLYGVLSAMGHKRIVVDVPVVEEGSETSQEVEGETSEEKPQSKPELDEFYLKRGKAFESKKSAGGAKSFKKSDKPKASKERKGGKRNKAQNRQPKIMSAEAKKVEDSPFAILGQLKK